MKISSPTTFEMGLEEMVSESCYTCRNDCPGVTFEENTNAQYLINTILVDDKKYYYANYTTGIIDDIVRPCLALYTNEAIKFEMNLSRFEYGCLITKNDAKNYLRNVFIIDKHGEFVDPKNMIHIFKALEVIK